MVNNSENSIKTIEYKFRFKDGTQKTFPINLDFPSLLLRNSPRSILPDWAELSFEQCENCPLSITECAHCPVAASLLDIIDFFKESASYAMAHITVNTQNREVTKRTSLQVGISSMIGLCMAASGCPRFEFLRPLLFVHLPFSSMEETLFRVISMYLMGQFFIQKNGGKADCDLTGLAKKYEEISIVNRCIIRRFKSININDASINALVTLECFAENTSFSISKGALSDVEQYFKHYLK